MKRSSSQLLLKWDFLIPWPQLCKTIAQRTKKRTHPTWVRAYILHLSFLEKGPSPLTSTRRTLVLLLLLLYEVSFVTSVSKSRGLFLNASLFCISTLSLVVVAASAAAAALVHGGGGWYVGNYLRRRLEEGEPLLSWLRAQGASTRDNYAIHMMGGGILVTGSLLFFFCSQVSNRRSNGRRERESRCECFANHSYSVKSSLFV